MSIFGNFAKSLASESGELKKIRMESEKRRTVKSKCGPANTEEVIDKAIGALNNRIDRTVKTN